MNVDLYELWTLELFFLVSNSKVEIVRDKLVTSVKNNFINAAKLSVDKAVDAGQLLLNLNEVETELTRGGNAKDYCDRNEVNIANGGYWDGRQHSLLNIIKNTYCGYIQDSFETETKLKLTANNDDLERSHKIIMQSLLDGTENTKEQVERPKLKSENESRRAQRRNNRNNSNANSHANSEMNDTVDS
jgi:hypothetical protein